MKTHVYVTVDPRTPWTGDHNYGYLITADGREYKKWDYSTTEATYYRATLKALCEALDRFKPDIPCEIIIHCECAWVATQWENSLEKHWQFNGWRNKKGKEIQNRDLWQTLYNLTYMRRHFDVRWEKGEHKYSSMLRSMMAEGLRSRDVSM